MADDEGTAGNPLSTPLPNAEASQDRADLIVKARTFLATPHVVHQDASAKRKFLVDKGLTDAEIDGLLRELPPQVPQVPPRTYPRPPPSNLPIVLLGAMRLLSWLMGGSAVIMAIYYQFFLPRLTLSQHARRALRAHHFSLLRRLTTSLAASKEHQAESFSILPRPTHVPGQTLEDAEASSLDALLAAHKSSGTADQKADIPETTILRCAIVQLTTENNGKQPTTEDLFELMIANVPWLNGPAGQKYQNDLWQTLSSSSLFSHIPSTDGTTIQWSYHPALPPPPPPEPKPYALLTSLSSLASALHFDRPSSPPPSPSSSLTPTLPPPRPFQRTLDALTALTGYLSAHMYTLPFSSSAPLPSSSTFRFPGIAQLSPQEEEIRREIRAFKGLILNRRSFMPKSSNLPTPQTTSDESVAQTP